MTIRQFNNKYEIFSCALDIRKKTGKPLITQIMEIISLKYGTNKLSAGEYYGYGLYDNSRYTSEKKRSFLGNQLTNRLNNIVNAVNWRALDRDKIVFAALMKGLGFQQPTLYAFYGPGHRHLSVSQFREPEEMAAFLRDGIVYPFFAKPVASLRSLGAAAVLEYDRSEDSLVFSNGNRVPVEQYVLGLKRPPGKKPPWPDGGHLFQKLLSPHEEVRELTSGSLATIRLVVLLLEDGPLLHRAAWKIPREGNMADNFWRRGNLLAGVNLDTGVVSRVLESSSDGFVTLDSGSDLGLALTGSSVPLWSESVALCLKAAGFLAETRVQHWDVAITDEGPVLLEMNGQGGISLTQCVSTEGLMDSNLRQLFSELNVTL